MTKKQRKELEASILLDPDWSEQTKKNKIYILHKQFREDDIRDWLIRSKKRRDKRREILTAFVPPFLRNYFRKVFCKHEWDAVRFCVQESGEVLGRDEVSRTYFGMPKNFTCLNGQVGMRCKRCRKIITDK